MSQLRKSASFRSRIPVRRNRFAHRRCCSPQPTFFGDSEAVGRSCGCVPYYKLRTNRSFAFEGNHHPSSSGSHHHNYRYNHRHNKHRARNCIEQGCSSSSYSSSDESCESEAAHQKFVRQSRETPVEHTLYVSTDALSLDGLLDSVSCGSFSSPPSPVHYQNTEASLFHRCSSYESLEKYNIALESFQISEDPKFLAYSLSSNVGISPKENFMIHCAGSNKNNYSYNNNNSNNNNNNNDKKQEQKFVVNNKPTTTITTAAAAATSREARQPSAIKTLGISKATTSTTAATKMATKSGEVVGASKDDASKKSFYIEKQKQLSDWYYIKTKKDVVVIEDNNVDVDDDGVDDDGRGNGDSIVEKEADIQNYGDGQKTKNLLSPNLKNFVLFDRIEALCSGAPKQINDECKQHKINYDENFSAPNEKDDTIATTNESLFLEHEYVNSIRHHQHQQQHPASAIKSSQSVAASLPGTTAAPALRYARYATDSATTTSESQPPFKWNNFDQQQLGPTANTQQQQPQQQQQQSSHNTCYQRETADYNDTTGDIEVEYNEAVDALNKRKPNCPPYYCPPNYAAHQSYKKETKQQQQQQQQQQKSQNSNFSFVAAAAASSPEHVDFCNVNVRLLKQHYQQQQQQQQQQKRQEQQSAAAAHAAFATPAEYANMSFRKRIEPGKRNKNKIELQLEHWENIGNCNNNISSSSSNIADACVGVSAGGVAGANVLSKGQRAATSTTSTTAGSSNLFQQNVNAKAGLTSPTKPQYTSENDGPQLISHKNQQQHQNLQQQQHHFNRSHCSFNKTTATATHNNSNGNNNAAVTGTNSKNNNIRTSSSSDNINTQGNSNNNNNNSNRSNILHQQQKQQKQLSHDTVVETTFQQQQQQRQLPLEKKMQQQQQQQQQHMHFNQHSVKQQQQECNRDICLVVDQPNVTPRLLMLPTPPTATPRTALRSRLIQKRPDETSCSSFEQLNIVGIPTDEDDDDNDVDDDVNGDGDVIGGGAGFANEDDTSMAVPVGGITSAHCDVVATQMDFDTGILSSTAATRDGSNQRQRQEQTCFAVNENVNAFEANVSSNPTEDFLSIYEEHEERLLLPVSRVVNFSERAHVQSQSRVQQHQQQQQQQDHDVTLLEEGNQRPLPDLPKQLLQKQQQIQLQLHQHPHTRQLFGVVDNEMFPPKTTPSCRSECELSGSYASLECPSPPGPPVCLPESRRDPQARLATYFRTFYTDLSLKEPIVPQWAIPVAPGALCAARLEPELKLNPNSHGFSDSLTVDQILVSVQTKDGSFLEAPRRCLIECPAWTSRSNLCLRILHAWAKEPPWPAKGTPVAFALFIPLAEVKRSFAHYVEKELLPKGPLNPFANGIGGFSAAWSSLETLGPKLLIILDGYDSQKLGNPSSTPKKSKSNSSLVGGASKHLYPTDVHDLLDGKLFPDARVIITTSTTNYPELLPIIQRHLTYEGLTWGRSACLLGGGQWGGPSRLLDAIQESVHLRKMVKTPLGCLAITTIYETSNGDLPTDELDVVESVLNCVAPEASTINVAELGRLALFCLKMKRPNFTLAEMRMYCSTPESILLGCLDKNLLVGKSAKKKCEYVYNPICPGMMELLAANYIASLAARPGLLAAEITGMAVGDGELDADLLKVLKFSMTILGDRAHILLSRLTPLWLTPQIVFTLALAGGHAEDNLAALCDILGISKHPPISPLETKPLWVQVRSVPTDLMGWGMALKSPTCTLKNLEVIYQLEKHNLLESRKAIEIFLDSIILNESVTTLRLSSLIEMDVKDSEISYLANCVSKLLLKPRLENFELVLTLLEEDPPILKLQSVVAALCRTIPRQPRLSFLLLDLTFSTSQLVQLCSTLEKCPNVTRLSLPHLRCERGAITALASLLNSRPISFLSLPSCWGARDDPPSSSGVSMGSGSGSSTGTSGLIKQGSLPGVPSPRSYAPGIFSSLPRGVFIPQSSLGRSATLPRQPLEQTLDKRSCDSVVSKTWYPTPACDGGPHNSGTLHDLLLAARDSYSKLHGLDLSKAQLSLEDSMCLGETVRLSNTLHTLKLEGSSRLSEILPSILGASESSCLQMLSIGSPRLSLEDSAIAMCARALTSCSTLRLLSLDGWNFRLENAATLSILRAFLSLTSIRELSLANCRLHISLVKNDTKISHEFESRSVVVLKLAGAQATLADATIMRGPQLLQYIGGFPCLRELDLSAPARSGLGSAHTTPLILDDKCIISFFQNLHAHFSLLNTLKICHWVIHFDEFSKTLKNISKCMRNSPISHIKMDGISVLDRPKKQRSESNFVHCFISSLPQLRWMGISLAGKKEDHITAIGNAVLDLKGYEIDIKLSESTIEQAKLMAQAISLDGKFDIKVSTFGTSSGILVHAEKSGTKSLTRKNKD